MTKTQQIQEIFNVPADDVWGPKSQAALIAGSKLQKEAAQRILGVEQDGRWGPVSQSALNRLTSSVFHCKASSFADPADLIAFNRCKATGKSDIKCFAVGDNGIGQFGKITSQDKIPMVAVHKSDMVKRWGSIAAAAHRPVKVTVKGKTIDATVEDRISAPGRIDLNPACAKLLGLRPPFVVSASWRWA